MRYWSSHSKARIPQQAFVTPSRGDCAATLHQTRSVRCIHSWYTKPVGAACCFSNTSLPILQTVPMSMGHFGVLARCHFNRLHKPGWPHVLCPRNGHVMADRLASSTSFWTRPLAINLLEGSTVSTLCRICPSKYRMETGKA